MATQVQGRDAMQFINEQDATTLDRFIERLEFRAKDPTFTAYREAYLELLDLPRVEAVLDLGCGTGVVTRAIAARDGFAGTVTGVDQSPAFIAAAERLAAAEGLGDRVEFVVGDAHALDLPAASFDVAVAHTLVSHVRDPLAVLAEAARVIRPSGSVAVFDGDYSSLTFACDDAPLGEAMEGAVQSIIKSSPGSCASFRVCCRRPGCGSWPRRPTSTPKPERAASCSTWPRRTGRWRPRRPRARGAGGCVARRPAPLRRGRHLLRGLQLLRVHRAGGHLAAVAAEGARRARWTFWAACWPAAAPACAACWPAAAACWPVAAACRPAGSGRLGLRARRGAAWPAAPGGPCERRGRPAKPRAWFWPAPSAPQPRPRPSRGAGRPPPSRAAAPRLRRPRRRSSSCSAASRPVRGASWVPGPARGRRSARRRRPLRLRSGTPSRIRRRACRRAPPRRRGGGDHGDLPAVQDAREQLLPPSRRRDDQRPGGQRALAAQRRERPAARRAGVADAHRAERAGVR